MRTGLPCVIRITVIKKPERYKLDMILRFQGIFPMADEFLNQEYSCAKGRHAHFGTVPKLMTVPAAYFEKQ